MLVEDHPVLRNGLEALLSSEGFSVVASTASAGEALELLDSAAPDLALVDIFLGAGGNGIDLAREIGARRPEVAVVFYTGHEDRDLALASLGAGARGYVVKDHPPQELVRALRLVAAGGTYVDSRLGPMATVREA